MQSKKQSSGSNPPVVSIVLGSLNRSAFLKLAVDSVRKEVRDVHHEIIVVDGGSADGSLAWLMKQKDIVTIVQHNRGEWNGKPIKKRSWGYFINLAFQCAQGKYVCMISDDCLLIPGCIKNGIAAFDRKIDAGEKVGGLAFWWRNWPGQPRYGVQRHFGQLNINHGMYLREALESVGYADEETFQFYFGEVDLAFKLSHAGYKIEAAENSYLEHYWHANFGQRQQNWELIDQENEALRKKWQSVFPKAEFSPENRFHREESDWQDPDRSYQKFRRLHYTNPGYYKDRLLKRLDAFRDSRKRTT